VKEAQVRLVRIGALEELFFSDEPASVNLRPDGASPVLLSTRALEPLYNIDRVLRAFAALHEGMPEVRLQVAGEGSQRTTLEVLAHDLGLNSSVSFLGRLTPPEMRDALSAAHVYVSVPSSDSLAASTMEAMARGAFPVVADLPSLDGFIENGVNGLCVPADVASLTAALRQAVSDAEMRMKAVEPNRRKIEAEGRLAAQVDRLEAAFYHLAGIA
jgi:glycosyltransferase involved in cell wall biosynthesis